MGKLSLHMFKNIRLSVVLDTVNDIIVKPEEVCTKKFIKYISIFLNLLSEPT